MIRGVLFDLDGTLIDSTGAIVTSLYHTFDTLGLPRPDRKTIVDSIGFPLAVQLGMLTSHDAGECTRIYRAHYMATANGSTTLLPGTRELLAALACAGMKIGFATSKKRSAAEMLLEHLGVLHYFEVRLGPDDVIHAKPHPEVVEKAVALMGLRLDEVLFVGDMYFDVEAGKAAGVRTIAVATGYNTRAELEALQPHAVIDSLHELLDGDGHLLPL
ncbi:MAG: HAD-IA family hydrolase [Candidatus Hydrogenedentes bacterium]|nr:HAD-IA family hydrolase [Candidatus Hydrogenedentota bacterium]